MNFGRLGDASSVLQLGGKWEQKGEGYDGQWKTRTTTCDGLVHIVMCSVWQLRVDTASHMLSGLAIGIH